MSFLDLLFYFVLFPAYVVRFVRFVVVFADMRLNSFKLSKNFIGRVLIIRKFSFKNNVFPIITFLN